MLPSLESLERRRLDYLLIETLKQVGVSNYSLIARLTGLNPETVRYKVNKQLARMGLSVDVSINYEAMGLIRGILDVKASPTAGRSWVDLSSYLTFASKTVGSNRYICMYAIPYRYKKKYNDFLDSLKQSGMIEEFSASEIAWVRNPPFRSEFYDFDSNRWAVDWKRVNMASSEVGATSAPVDRDAKVDYIDLKILKCMQEDCTSNLTKIAKAINANPRTVRYHYANHVKNNFVLGHNIRVKNPKEGDSDLMQLVCAFRRLDPDEIKSTRRVLNRIPFTWLEAGTQNDGYFAFLDVSPRDFHETVRYVEQGTSLDFETAMLDPSKTRLFTIPDEMYDKRMGWRLTPVQYDTRETSQGDHR